MAGNAEAAESTDALLARPHGRHLVTEAPDLERVEQGGQLHRCSAHLLLIIEEAARPVVGDGIVVLPHIGQHAQEALNRYEAELVGEARERVRAFVLSIANDLARDYGLLAIFAKRAPVWLKPGVELSDPAIAGRARFEITDLVVERYDREANGAQEESM